MRPSLGDVYLVATLVWMLVLTPPAILTSERNDLRSIAENVAVAGGVAAVLAAWCTVPLWLVLRFA